MTPGTGTARGRQAGQVAVESVLVTLLVAIVLLTGDPSPLERLLDAFQQAYARFSFAIAMP